jgi:AmmeMemoRadiSam system protein B
MKAGRKDAGATRESDFAGSWYPGEESDCRQTIEEFSEVSAPCPQSEKPMVGGIVPHAGWYYSGKIACHVIKCLKNRTTPPDTIVLFGRHLSPGSSNYMMKEGKWATPLGILEIDADLGEKLASEFRFTIETPRHHEQDNTIELQLPFIKHFFPDVKILPLGVPPHPASLSIGERAAEIASSMGKEILVLGSTDLTHYGYNYGYAPKGTGKAAVDWVKNENDRRVVDLILKMDPEGVIHESLRSQNACCSGAVAAAISAAKKLGAVKGEKLHYATSYDTQPNTSFVGYVGVVFS